MFAAHTLTSVLTLQCSSLLPSQYWNSIPLKHVNGKLDEFKTKQVLELEEEAGEDVEDDDGAVAAAWGRGKEGLPSTAAADAEAGAEVAAATANVNSVYMLQARNT